MAVLCFPTTALRRPNNLPNELTLPVPVVMCASEWYSWWLCMEAAPAMASPVGFHKWGTCETSPAQDPWKGITGKGLSLTDPREASSLGPEPGVSKWWTADLLAEIENNTPTAKQIWKKEKIWDLCLVTNWSSLMWFNNVLCIDSLKLGWSCTWAWMSEPTLCMAGGLMWWKATLKSYLVNLIRSTQLQQVNQSANAFTLLRQAEQCLLTTQCKGFNSST